MEIKDLLSHLGIEAEDVEAFKKGFDEKYISKQVHDDDLVKTRGSHGKQIGLLQQKIKTGFESLGVAFEDGSLKDKKADEVFEMGLGELSKTIATFKDVKGDDKAEKIKADYEAKLSKAMREIEDHKGFFLNERKEKETIQQTLQGQIRDFKLGHILSSEVGKVKLKKNITDLEKKGFDAHMKSKYRFDIGENDEPIVFQGDERVKDHQGFLTPAQVYEKEAKELNLLEMNPNGGKPAGQTYTPKVQTQEQAPIPGRRVHPGLQKQGR